MPKTKHITYIVSITLPVQKEDVTSGGRNPEAFSDNEILELIVREWLYYDLAHADREWDSKVLEAFIKEEF